MVAGFTRQLTELAGARKGASLFVEAGVEVASGVEPVDERDDPPERRHGPVEGPAVLVMPEEPEGEQRDQDEE